MNSHRPKSVDDVSLSSSCTVAQYRLLEASQKKDEIAAFIEQRFVERFITPIETCSQRHGFSTMAVSCLMIETLESFWRGWPDTRGRSELAFCSFFQRTPALVAFHGHATEFYVHVRCGILHQAETTGGWRIQKSGPLFDAALKTVGSDEFLAGLKTAITSYSSALRQTDWAGDPWVNFRTKMNSICANCA